MPPKEEEEEEANDWNILAQYARVCARDFLVEKLSW